MRLSDELELWRTAAGERTLGSLVETFEEKGFAIAFVVLLAVPALPLPTGGATHVLELVAIVLALQLVAGRERLWLPRRWRALPLATKRRQRLLARLVALVRRVERYSRPRGRFLFGHRATNAAFGALVAIGSATAFVAPPFSWLDTLPALGVVVLSLGVLLEDVVVAGAGILVGAAGVALVLVLGRAAVEGIGELVLAGA